MNRSQKNNNPLNIRYAGQIEATGQDDKGFAICPDAPAGCRMAHKQVKKDQARGLSMMDFINKFAPPSENDTDGYAAFVCLSLGVSLNAPLKSLSAYAVAGVMAQIEGYYAP